MTTVAAVDCGTNAVRLLIADIDVDGQFTERARIMRIVRLGEGVDRTGEFSAPALARTFAALDEYAGLIAEAGVQRVRFVATSASRDVSNREEFVSGVQGRLGVVPEVITGIEEAALSFAGAVRGLPAGLVDLPALVVDIGGGSTEFVLGRSAPEQSVSIDIGCVRMTERHLAADPPTATQIEAARRDIEAQVTRAYTQVNPHDALCLVGLAGTVTTVSAMAMDLPRYDAAVLHGSVIQAQDVASVSARLLQMTHGQRAELAFMHPGRVDVIGAGAMILDAITRLGGFARVIVSETDILDGIVYSMAAS